MAALLLFADFNRAKANREDLLKNGPRVPQNVSMSHLIVDGLIGPGWPVGVWKWIQRSCFPKRTPAEGERAEFEESG